jgi:sodium/proline symporter
VTGADSAAVWKIIGVSAYLLILLAIGLVASRRMGNLRDYYAGNKQFSFWAAAFSARATGESAWLLLGLTGMGATIGIKAFWVVLGEVLGVGCAWLLMCRRFKRLTDRYDAITIPDYLEARFRDHSHRIRVVAAGAMVVFVTIYVSAQIHATGTAFESFLGVNYFVGAVLGFGIVAAYITTGGFVAVVWSDVFQGVLMFVGLVTLPIVGLWMAGGWGVVAASLTQLDPSLMSWSGGTGWTWLTILEVLGLCLIGLGFLGSPQIFVRFLSLKSVDEVKPGAAVALIWTIFADSGAVVIGLVGRHLLVGRDLGTNGQDVLPLLVEHALPAVLVGLFIAIVLSAIMSTVDSLLLVASSGVVRDWYQQVKGLPEAALMPLSRWVTMALALAALLLALLVAIINQGQSVFWFVIFGWSGIAATFCPTIILSLAWTRFTGRGALGAMIAGFFAVPLFKFGATALPVAGPYFAKLTELPPAFALSALVGVLLSIKDTAGHARLTGIEAELRGMDLGSENRSPGG